MILKIAIVSIIYKASKGRSSISAGVLTSPDISLDASRHPEPMMFDTSDGDTKITCKGGP